MDARVFFHGAFRGFFQITIMIRGEEGAPHMGAPGTLGRPVAFTAQIKRIPSNLQFDRRVFGSRDFRVHRRRRGPVILNRGLRKPGGAGLLDFRSETPGEFFRKSFTHTSPAGHLTRMFHKIYELKKPPPVLHQSGDLFFSWGQA